MQKKDISLAAVSRRMADVAKFLSDKKDVEADLEQIIASLTIVAEQANEAISVLTKRQFKLSDHLWASRSDAFQGMNPCEFVIAAYPLYGHSLTQADIRRFDFQLYQALHNYRKKHGWPEDFRLPSKKESNDAAAAAHSSLRLRAQAGQPEATQKEIRRVYSASQRRQTK